MSNIALHEPAILLLIFQDFSLRELLHLQDVCQSWRSTIQNDNIIASALFLRPGLKPRVGETPRLNPFLQNAFKYFFLYTLMDGFTTGHGNSGPWMGMAMTNGSFDGEKLKRHMVPGASWRQMIPCYPPPTQLQVHVSTKSGRGKIMLLNFENKFPDECRPSHPPWLTFGLLYDIAENAWFQGSPWHLTKIGIEVADMGRKNELLLPKYAVMDRARQESRLQEIGYVRLNLVMDRRSQDKRQKLRDQAFLKRMSTGNGPLPKPHPIPDFDQHAFTDEFHFDGSLSLSGIEWDGVQEYGVVPRPRKVSRSLGSHQQGVRVSRARR